eukprot:jgi/Hompol1/6739/HPOL_001546-RA
MFNWLFGDWTNAAPRRASSVASIKPLTPAQIAQGDIDEIKEFHFHVYWFVKDPKTHAKAIELRDKILALNESGYFVAKPLNRVNEIPIGPHPIGSYEVWVPQEHFARAYSWFLLNRPPELMILLHPLTRQERRDHSERAVFLGGPPGIPIKLDELRELADKLPLQYPELGLGYSASQ